MIHRILNQFSRKGRITRGEYIISLMIFVAICYPLSWIDKNYNLPVGIKEPLKLLSLPLFAFILLRGARRCHDRGNSGLYQFIPGYFFLMILGDSDYGINTYGPNPKGQGNDSMNTTTDDFRNALISNLMHSHHCNHCKHHSCNCNHRR